jgi:F0F1-type ATP synthase alpha subunit
MREDHSDILQTIREEKELSGETEEKLREAVEAFAKVFAA